jgi:hypothetical protein
MQRQETLGLGTPLSAIIHDLPVICSPNPSLKGPVDFETCRTTYGKTSALLPPQAYRFRARIPLLNGR